MAMKNALEALHELLCSLFDVDELRRLALFVGGKALADSLPATEVSLASFTFRLCGRLAKHGLLRDSLFAWIRRQRPHRRDEIDRVEMLFARVPLCPADDRIAVIEELYDRLRRDYDPGAIIEWLKEHSERMFCGMGLVREMHPEPQHYRFSLLWYEDLPGKTNLYWTTLYQLPLVVPTIFHGQPQARDSQPGLSHALEAYIDTLVAMSQAPVPGTISVRGFAGWRRELCDKSRLQQWTGVKRKLAAQQITLRTMEGFIDAIARDSIGEHWTSMDLRHSVLRTVV